MPHQVGLIAAVIVGVTAFTSPTTHDPRPTTGVVGVSAFASPTTHDPRPTTGVVGVSAFASPTTHDPRPTTAVTIGRLHYDGGGDWYANPSSLPNLLTAIRDRTGIRTAEREESVKLSDDRIWALPYLYMTGHGNVRFSDQDLVTLREWLRRGGFLHVDDNFGMDESIRRELVRLFPGQPMVEVPLDHPVYHLVYDFPRGLPKIHEHDGKPAQGFGIFLEGRLVVYYSYDSDLGDGWEDPEVHHDTPEAREAALRMGVNLFTYAVSGGH